MSKTVFWRATSRIAAAAALAAGITVAFALPASAAVAPADTIFYENFQSYSAGNATGSLGPWIIEDGATILLSSNGQSSSDGNLFLGGDQVGSAGPAYQNFGPVAISRTFPTVAGTPYQVAVQTAAGGIGGVFTGGFPRSDWEIYIDGVLVDAFTDNNVLYGDEEYAQFTATGQTSTIRIVSTGVGNFRGAGTINGVAVYDTTECSPLPVSIASPPVAAIGLGIIALGAVIAVVIIRRRDTSTGQASTAIATLSLVAVLGVAGLVVTSAAPVFAGPSISVDCEIALGENF